MASMTVIARDGVASDHLVYAWPFPIGPDCEVTCSDDEQVIMCPAYLVGDRLGPGHHRWRTPDPMRPVAAFFVLTSPVEAPFDMTTSFIIPTTGQPVRLRATGAVQVRCADPGLLIAQFVGLPFDSVNDGILRSVSRSIERMLARLLTRRVVMAATPLAVTDPQMMASIVEELVAYNPTAGAVFGVELTRMGHMMVGADDGNAPQVMLPAQSLDWSGGTPRVRTTPPPVPPNGNRPGRKTDTPPLPLIPPNASANANAASGDIPLLETVRGRPPTADAPIPSPRRTPSTPPTDARGSEPNLPRVPVDGALAQASGEIRVRAKSQHDAATLPPPIANPSARAASVIEVPRTVDEITQPNLKTPIPGSVRIVPAVVAAVAKESPPPADEPRGAILGIGMGHIGSVTTGSVASGEISKKVAPGARVLVPGPNGLMQSATVRQLLSGYYELEVGSSGETIWVPVNGVVPE
jgi:hypothetical protein